MKLTTVLKIFWTVTSTICSVLSWVLLISILAVWARSFQKSDKLAWFGRETGTFLSCVASKGKLSFLWLRPNANINNGPSGHFKYQVDDPEDADSEPYLPDMTRSRVSRRVGSVEILTDLSGKCIVTPFYVIFLICSVLPTVSAIQAFRLVRRKHRHRSGRCIHCGYILLGSADRCSECGMRRPTK